VESTHHFGVYGLWTHAGKLVLVRKTRGPYTGFLDLPGGTPERGESRHETLRRGASIDFHHEGWIAEVRVDGSLSYTIEDQDVSGVVLVESLPNEQLSPLVIEALRLFPALRIGRRCSR
jgi:hypothetical protein